MGAVYTFFWWGGNHRAHPRTTHVTKCANYTYGLFFFFFLIPLSFFLFARSSWWWILWQLAHRGMHFFISSLAAL